MAFLQGELVRVIFQQEDFVVGVFKNEDGRSTAVGPLLTPETGLVYALEGDWGEHPKFGRQFRFSTYRLVPPATPRAMEKFLASGLIKGIGRKTARKLVKAFGVEVLAIIRDEPDRIRMVPGISQNKAATVIASYQEFAVAENLLAVLTEYGLTSDLVFRIFRRYGRDSLAMIEENPFRLCLELPGVSFAKCDAIAHRYSYNGDESKRIQAGILYTLAEARDAGQVYLPVAETVAKAGELLTRSVTFSPGPTLDQVAAELVAVATAGEVHVYADGCYLPELWIAEATVARLLARLAIRRQPWAVDVAAVIQTMEKDFAISYAPEQKAAFSAVANHDLIVITGGPGTGKTTIVRGLLALINRARPQAKVVLCAPTGRAAKRLATTTEHPASTLHRLLKITAFEGDRLLSGLEPLEADVVVVDEVSMVDLVMMANLLETLPPGTKLILVGDQDQLPSIRAGQVLRDLVEHRIGKLIRLQHVFRQAHNSAIVVGAHQINRGEVPDLTGTAEFVFLKRQTPAHILEALVLTVERAVERAGFTLDDIQVLTPMRYTPVGVWNLNKVLQARFNQPGVGKREVQFGNLVFRTGDKIMQVVNNYDKNVFNGDTGMITEILLAGEEEADEDTIMIRFDEEKVTYGRSEWEQLTLAYAATVHKAQGSEYPVVVMPVTLQHHRMLRRNLVYTAVTRAREKVVLIGDPAALAVAVSNDRDVLRNSRLPARFQEEVMAGESRANEAEFC
ncbi:MAG: ATP-dependent RecD-like DNA helicase [Heliobacteriaceae bacterium]|nr:ATP-dependent RecD-like DNA helicase [Heliobacteriaceae bacterium]MDD4587273.1 ATP-dependent RecD-like DNA helicase [Heliobacteriaceae bacterium]